MKSLRAVTQEITGMNNVLFSEDNPSIFGRTGIDSTRRFSMNEIISVLMKYSRMLSHKRSADEITPMDVSG